MYKKSIMWDFIKEIYDNKMMTDFIKNIFDYENFYDYNYLFRMIEESDKIIIDIYDNVSDNRFNRYIFSFKKLGFEIKVIEEKNVFVNYISIYDTKDNNNKLLKFAYLFKLDKNEMIEYARLFLDKKFVLILDKIINKNKPT